MIDVILCCYQQEKYIAKALSSILEQTVEDDIHLIVADDCSTDGTMRIIDSILVDPVNNVKVEVLPSRNNVGISRNYQRAFARCTGEFVLVLEGDDWWISSKHIQSHVRCLQEHPEISMCANTIMTYNNHSFAYAAFSWGEIKTFDIHHQIINNVLGNLSACCFRTELVKALPPSAFELLIADYFLGIVMAMHGEIALLPEPTSVWRTGVGQWSSKKAGENRAFLMKEIDRYDAFLDYRFTEDFQKAKVHLGPHLNLTWRDFIPKAVTRTLKFLSGRL